MLLEQLTPESGITSYILSEHHAPFQQAFYFTNANVTNDGKYMWFYASYPPSLGQCLGVIDMVEQEVRVYPETRFISESPWIDSITGCAYWAIDANVHRRGPVWQSFQVCYKHAQFSPTDPDTIMLAQDHWEDIKTGESFGYKNRIWLICKGDRANPLFAEDSGKNVHRH
ncbi:hypothetical protein QFZ77_005997 [Paenibacillus sp. V4I3]|uniref:hypothetical protein n=1 Tax=unclassified Paenibacillus TaxID=185978 RepID=UPI002787C61D|nr:MULTISPECIES: hypothetical protein [unclassified Paenibacillus]MDQ0877338.1 hypothetical protein [Paenibacillus sp. V4I3]MDQ0886797.1 hypothetical protein [Paenibacillus sp. V4I9]